MSPSQSSKALNGRFQLFRKGYFPNQLIVLFECAEPCQRFELLKRLFFMLIPIFVHFFLVVFLEQSMLKHKFFNFVPFVESAVVFFDDEMLYARFLLCIVIPKFQICQQKLSVLVVLHVKLIALFVEVLNQLGISRRMVSAEIIDFLKLFVIVVFPVRVGGKGGDGGGVIDDAIFAGSDGGDGVAAFFEEGIVICKFLHSQKNTGRQSSCERQQQQQCDSSSSSLQRAPQNSISYFISRQLPNPNLCHCHRTFPSS